MPARRRVRLGAEQMSALLSPVRLEVVEAFQVYGPQTVADLAGRLGRPPDALYYHVGKLVEAGALEQRGARESGRGRNGAVYAVASSEGIEMDLDPRSKKSREAWTRGTSALLRQAGREVGRAVASGRARTKGRRRNVKVSRTKAWLTGEDLAELNEHVDAIERLLRRCSARGRGRLHAVTTAFAPLEGYTPRRSNR